MHATKYLGVSEDNFSEMVLSIYLMWLTLGENNPIYFQSCLVSSSTCSDISEGLFLLLVFFSTYGTFIPCFLFAWIISLLSLLITKKSSKIILTFPLDSLCSSLLLSALIINCRAEDCLFPSSSEWLPACHLAHIMVYSNYWSKLIKYLVGIYALNKPNDAQVKHWAMKQWGWARE